MSSAFADIEDQQDAQSVELSENVARDFIEYFRGNVVGHEQNGLLMFFSLTTGWAYDDGCHNNVLGFGAPGSGKSLTKNVVGALIDSRDKYTKTDASSNAILDSVEWDLALVAVMDEYDKIDRNIVEVLKSSNPEDGGYAKDRNVEDNDAPGGYSPTEVSAEANPWVVLYAPSSKKGGVNDELQDRALTLYFSNDKHTRRGILRKEFGHDSITTSASDEEYIYDTHALEARLRQHLRDLPVRAEQAEDEDGQLYTAARSGAMHVYMPQWVVYACEPIFNIDEDYSNRVFGLVNNAIRASAILNHQNRPRKTVDIYVDEDSTETEEREAVVVGPQDVANVLSCMEALLSTTHQLTPLKRHILEAVDQTSSQVEGDGTTLTRVQEWLDDNDIPHPSESTLRDRMSELSENYYLQSFSNAGGKNGTATVYERHDEGALQTPNVRNLGEKARRIDGIELATDDCVDIDPADPFDGCHDPIRDQPFKDTITELDAQFSSGSSTTDDDSIDMMEAMGGDSSDNDTTDSGGQAALDGYEDDADEPSIVDEDEDSVELDPDGEPDTPTEQWLYEALCERDGEPVGEHRKPWQYVIDPPSGSTYAEADLSGTVVDPTHELWQSRADHTDDRVIDETDAKRELTEAWSALEQKGLVAADSDAAPPKMCVLRAATE